MVSSHKYISYLQTVEQLSQTLDAFCHLQKTVLLQFNTDAFYLQTLENCGGRTFKSIALVSPRLSSTAELHRMLSCPVSSLSDPREVELILSVLR